MTSQINLDIDIAYPIAGEDNDSQGFRDNFNSIKNALSTAKTEITGLQTNAVLVADLSTNDPVNNNLLGSTLRNGLYNNFHGVVREETITASSTINIENGPLQVFTVGPSTSTSATLTLTFTNWPLDLQYASVRVHLKNSHATHAFTPTISTENGGDIVYETGFPSLLLGNTITITGSNSSTDEFECTSTAKLTVNAPIKFSSSVGGVSSSTVYYVKTINVDTQHFTVSESSGGTVFELTTSTDDMTATVPNTKHKVIEGWTYNSGATVFVKYIGEF